MFDRSDKKAVLCACGSLGVAALFLLASSNGSQQLYASAATGLRPSVTKVTPYIGTRGTFPLTNVAEPSADQQQVNVPYTVETTLGGEAFTEPNFEEAQPKSLLPMVFNFLSTSFFAILLYFRRKAALAQEYLAIENAGEKQPSLALATMSANATSSSAGEEPKSGFGKLVKTLLTTDYGLFLCLTFWYVGNYYYNITNKYALQATGGAAGTPLTVASLQLAVGVLYGLFLWVAPDARQTPKITWDDIVKMIPLSIAFAGAHFSTVFAMSAGAVSFGQIVKASEPAFAALLGTLMYSQSISTAKWLSLVPVIGGVCLASAAELDFSVAALVSGVIANLFAAVKANENKKAMDTPGLKDRLGTVGNQFAVTMTLSWLLSLPLVLLAEWKNLPLLVTAWKTNPIVSFNIISAGLWFYLYNELATIVVKKTNAVTQSVANTAKRVIVIVACGLVLGERLDTLKLVGCTIGILGVFLYSIIDDIIKPKPKAVTGTV